MSSTSVIAFQNELDRVRKTALKPPPKLSLSEWADNYRFLSRENSASPGRWRTASAPYQREILDAMADPQYEMVIGMLSSQLGKTEMVTNAAFYYVAQDPSPILIVMPTMGAAHKFSKQKLSPAIRDTPAVSKLFTAQKNSLASETITEKYFTGGSLSMVGAESPNGLSMSSIRILICDEVDRFPYSAGDEGDPFALAKQRTSNFWNKKIIAISTPTDEETSRIYKLYIESDQRKYNFQCVHCEGYWEPKWEHVHWQKDETVEPHTHKPETARLVCPNCGGLHTNHERLVASHNGIWVKNNPTSKNAGFHTSALAGKWATLQSLVEEWLVAAHDPLLRKVFYNVKMGIPYADLSKNIDDLDFDERLEPYTPTEMPLGVTYLTSGTDIQGDRIETSVWGWGVDDESWLIEHNVIHGETTLPATWKLLEEYLKTKFRRADGIYLPIKRAAIDSGHLATIVHQFTNGRRYWYSVKGAAGNRNIFPTLATKSHDGYRMYVIGTDNAKDMIFTRLTFKEHGAGYVHFPESATPEYFQQLAAEKKVQKTSNKGKTFWEWKQVPEGARNEALDCFVYALAAKTSIKINISHTRARQLAQLKKQQEEQATATAEPVAVPIVEEQAPTLPDVEQVETPAINTTPAKKIPIWKQNLKNRKRW